MLCVSHHCWNSSAMRNLSVLYTRLLLTLNVLLCGFPIQKNVSALPTKPSVEQIKFMQQFGYLPEDSPGTLPQYTDEYITKAIIKMQQFAGINSTGIIDLGTIKLMKKRRCGVKDIFHNNNRRKRYSVVGKGWRKREITYHIANWTPKIGEEGVQITVRRVFDLWASYGNLTFTETMDQTADIVIYFGAGDHGDTYPFDGPGGILAHAFFPYVRFGGSVHFDDEENWALDKLEEYDRTDFATVALHEIGHALGLAHSTVPEAIMYPYYVGSTVDYHDMQLHYDDTLAMYELYIKNSFATETSSTTEPNSYEEEEDVEYVTTAAPEIPETDPYTTVASVDERNEIPMQTTTEHTKISFHGDSETVDVHKEHDDKHGLPIESTEEPVLLCAGKYDAISVLRGEIFVFKGKYIWRMQSRGSISEGYPILVHNIFTLLPRNFTKIDAVYEEINGDLTFFIDSSYWLYKRDTIVGPFPITNYGLPFYVHSVDAVLLWPKNQKTYLFKENIFWRFDETVGKLDDGYPKNMTRWRGIPNNINSAVVWNGLTYFFKGMYFWRFDDVLIKADRHYPLPTPQIWFGCPETEEVIKNLPRTLDQT